MTLIWITLSTLLLATGVIVIQRRRGLHVDDLLLWFILLFFLYNVTGSFSRIRLDDFEPRVYNVSAFVICLAALGILAGVIAFVRPAVPGDSTREMQATRLIRPGLLDLPRLAAAGMVGLGYFLMILNYRRLGGFADIVASFSNRVDRNAYLCESLGNYPYVHFLYVGFVFLLLFALLEPRPAGRFPLRPLLLPFGALAPLFAFYVAEGERSALLKFMFPAFLALCGAGCLQRRLRRRHLLAVASAYLMLTVIGNLRPAYQWYLATGDTQLLAQACERPADLLQTAEFAAVNFTLHRTVHEVEKGREFKFGRSYAQALPYLFPRRVHRLLGLTKKPTIADEFGEEVAADIGRERRLGFGFSPVAEAYVNFWYPGVIVVFILLTAALERINLWVHHRVVVVRCFGILLSPMILIVNRTSFASLFSFAAWISALGLLLVCERRVLGARTTAATATTEVLACAP